MTDQRPSGILPSNVDTLPTPEARRARRAPVGWLLVAILTFVLGIALTLILTAPRGGSTPQGPQQQPAASTVQSQPQGARQQVAVGAPLPAVNGISCDALESTIFHIHLHLAVFFDDQEQSIPYGIGIGQPWQVTGTDEGPFVDDGACFYWIHTHTEDGIIHIESPVRRSFTLGDFFAVWQQPLSATQVGPKQGQVITYVNGQRDSTNPPDIRLLPHQRIQLDVGADVPPYQFDFPPGD
jgi:hypothetical protein